MSCNTFIPIMDLVREVEALLAANYIDKNDPRITGGVFTNPTIKAGFLLDVEARLEFCRLVQECGLDAPFGKMWLANPLSPGGMLISYEESGQPLVKWASIQTTMEQAGVLGAAPTSLASRLAAEVQRSQEADTQNAGAIAQTQAAATLNAQNISAEVTRSTQRDSSVDLTIQSLVQQDVTLQAQINSIGGGNVPYLTYAAMVVDKANITNKMVLEVTNDTDQTKNGKYSYDGVSVFTKSAYDPVAVAARDATAKADKVKEEAAAAVDKLRTDVASKYSPIPYAWAKVDLGTITNALITGAGEVESATAYTLSGFIPVTKGDVYVLTNIKSTGSLAIRSTFTLYNGAKILLGLLSGGRTLVSETSSKDDKLLANIGDVNKLECARNSGVVIPQDGYIKVGFINSPDTILYKTDFSGLVVNTLSYIDKESLSLFKGRMQSAIIDPSFNGLGISNAIIPTRGKVTGTAANSIASIKYAVKKGQYVSVQATKYVAGQYNVWLMNAEDDYLANLDKFNELTYAKDGGGVFHTNLKVPEDGFIRVQGYSLSHTPPLLAIHDEPINITRHTVKDDMNIEFYENGFNRDTSPKSTFIGNPSWTHYTGKGATNNVTMTASKPYLLEAGDVLEYSLQATIDAGAFIVIPVNNNYNAAGAYPSDIIQMTINESMDLYSTGVDVLLDKNLLYTGNAKGGSVAYCNEHIDTVIVFLRPRKTSSFFSLHNSSEDYKVRIYNKDEYIQIRNAGLKERFRRLSKYRADTFVSGLKAIEIGPDATDYSGSYPSVLMFKGEVLQCIAGSRIIPFATSLVKDTNGVFKKRLTDHSVYSTGYLSGTPRLPIKASDENSYNHAQIYAKETANVIVSFSILDALGKSLDVDGLISSQSFEPTIRLLAETVVGDNLKPTLIRGVSTSIIGTGDVQSLLVGFRDTLISFVPAGTYVEYSLWASMTNTNAFYAPLNKPSTTRPYQFGVPSYSEWNTVRRLGPKPGDTISPEIPSGSGEISIKMGHYFDEDVMLVVTSRRAAPSLDSFGLETYNASDVNNLIPKITGLDAAYAVVHKTMLATNYSHTLRSIKESDFLSLYRVTDETYINIANTNGLAFNFCELVSPSLVNNYWSVMQIIQEGKVIAALNCETANQGQSSADFVRKNVNISFYNKDYKKVYIKFGDNIPEAEMVLKSYLGTDKGHFKDSLSCQLWYDIRTAEPYPIGGVFPPEAFYDTTPATNQSAKGAPFGFPVEGRRAGKFYGLGTARSKKKTPNYAMDSGNRNHILIQPDALSVGPLNWANINLANFEVRNPKMSGYTEGDENLPAGYADVEANLRRLIDWMEGVRNKTVDLPSTYKDFINLESVIDYGISINVLYHWDSMINNFLLGTHDGKVWYTYFYDGDRSWGGGQLIKDRYTNITLNLYNSLFRDVAAAFPREVNARYKLLRDKKVLDVSRHQNRILEMTNSMNPASRDLDELWWGKIEEGAQAPYSMQWFYHRIKVMDIHYGYKADPSIVLQSTYTLGEVLPGASKVVTLRALGVGVEDVLTVDYGEMSKSLEITYTITGVGEMNVSFKNTSIVPITNLASYLIIRKV